MKFKRAEASAVSAWLFIIINNQHLSVTLGYYRDDLIANRPSVAARAFLLRAKCINICN